MNYFFFAADVLIVSYNSVTHLFFLGLSDFGSSYSNFSKPSSFAPDDFDMGNLSYHKCWIVHPNQIENALADQVKIHFEKDCYLRELLSFVRNLKKITNIGL